MNKSLSLPLKKNVFGGFLSFFVFLRCSQINSAQKKLNQNGEDTELPRTWFQTNQERKQDRSKS